MNPDPSAHLQALHAEYCRLTGREMRWSYEAEQIWFAWWRIGNKVEDLSRVISYVKRLYQKRPDILIPILRLRKLIGDTLYFEQLLAEANQVVREKEKRTNRDKILEATGRPKEEKPNERSAGQVLDDVLAKREEFFAKQRETKEWKDFVKFKETL